MHFARQVVVFSCWECAAVYFLCESVVWLGFCCGVMAFSASFLGLEVVARRVFVAGGVKGGVRNGLFWVLFKFFVPLLLIYYGIWRRFSVYGIFGGFLVGLANVCFVLYQDRGRPGNFFEKKAE